MELLRDANFWLGMIFVLLTGCAVYVIGYMSSRHALRDERMDNERRNRGKTIH